jgi:hypothetical protein
MRVVALVFLGLALSSPATADAQATSRLRQTTNQSGARETSTEIEETPNGDGRMVPVRQTVVEVIRAGTIVRTTSETSRPDLNGRLRPMERTEHVERSITPQEVRSTTTASHVDVNNRWQVTEVRTHDARTIGGADDVEETIRQPDLNGTLWERQRSVSRVTRENGREDAVVETFDQGRYAAGSTTHTTMSGRMRRTTTPRGDGGHQIVEEVEERSLVAPDEPLRVVRRVVETTRRTGSGGWEMERQLFERDPNNRLILIASETEETSVP